jgi:cell division transport system permease protein
MPLNDPRDWRRLQTAVRSGLRGVRASPVVFTTSVVTMAAGLVLLGAFLLLVSNMRGTLARFSGRPSVVAFFAPGEDPAADRVEALKKQLAGLSGIEAVEFVSREAALTRLREDLGEDAGVLDEIKENPLPASFELRLTSEATTPDSVRALSSRIRKLEGIADVRYGKQWVEGYEQVLASVQKLGLAVGVGLVVLLGFMVGGTVRLAVHAREDEIQIQRLVGASGFHVRLPFYIQGVLQGAIGGVISVTLLYGAFRLGLPLVGESFQFLVATDTWSFLSASWVLAILVFGMGLGLGGAVLSLLNLEEAR